MKNKSKYKSIILFGILLAGLLLTLKFLQYKYFIASLDTEIYTSVVAVIFTSIGVWIGITSLKQKKTNNHALRKIDYLKIKELDLKEREYEILKLVSKGLSNQEIADELFIALPTVKTHTSNLYSKLDVKSRTQAIHKAQFLKLI